MSRNTNGINRSSERSSGGSSHNIGSTERHRNPVSSSSPSVGGHSRSNSGGSPAHHSRPGHMNGGPRPPHRGGFHRPPRQPRHYGHRRTYNGSRRSAGCGSYLVVLIFLIIILLFAVFKSRIKHSDVPISVNSSQDAQTNSNKSSSVNITEYYADSLDWIKDEATLLSGMKEFYTKTGVKPFLYIIEEVNGSKKPTYEALERFSLNLYDELFTDENYFLLVFWEYGNSFMSCYVRGNDTVDVITDDKADILLDSLSQLHNTTLSNEEYFSTAFSKTADTFN